MSPERGFKCYIFASMPLTIHGVSDQVGEA